MPGISPGIRRGLSMAETGAADRAAAVGISAIEPENEVFLMEFLSYLISGVSLGSVYALIALGLSLIHI